MSGYGLRISMGRYTCGGPTLFFHEDIIIIILRFYLSLNSPFLLEYDSTRIFQLFFTGSWVNLNITFELLNTKGCFTMDDETLIKLSYVKISSYRAKTVKSLHNEAKIPTVIAKDTGILPNHMSKVLKELKDAGVAECINEDSRKGRLYRLTPLGDEIAQNLEK